jgi:hypothetical protein
VPATAAGRRAKATQAAYFKVVFTYLLDWVYLYIVDQNIHPGTLDRFGEWSQVVTKKIRKLRRLEAVKDRLLEIGQWPSYAAVQSSRQWSSAGNKDGPDNFENPCRAI